jgi:hypothetical protein
VSWVQNVNITALISSNIDLVLAYIGETFISAKLANMAIPREELFTMPTILSVAQLAWLAGFIDADGTINAQIVKRDDYILKYQVRVTVTLFQSTKRHHILLCIQKLFHQGTVRKRHDGMSEFCIVGQKQVEDAVTAILPYLILKRRQARLVLQITKKLPYTKDPLVLLEACKLADKIGSLTDGKRRANTSKQVYETLQELGHDV